MSNSVRALIIFALMLALPIAADNILQSFKLPSLMTILSSPLTTVPAFILGCVFYYVRGTLPLVYGAIEVVVGIIVFSSVILSHGSDAIAKLIGIVGGIYIVVRGLDNIEKGLPNSLRPYWGRAFPKIKN